VSNFESLPDFTAIGGYARSHGGGKAELPVMEISQGLKDASVVPFASSKTGSQTSSLSSKAELPTIPKMVSNMPWVELSSHDEFGRFEVYGSQPLFTEPPLPTPELSLTPMTPHTNNETIATGRMVSETRSLSGGGSSFTLNVPQEQDEFHRNSQLHPYSTIELTPQYYTYSSEVGIHPQQSQQHQEGQEYQKSLPLSPDSNALIPATRQEQIQNMSLNAVQAELAQIEAAETCLRELDALARQRRER
jgi:hypothetical protein